MYFFACKYIFYINFEGEGGGGRLVGCLQIYSTLDSDVEGIPVARVSNKYVEVQV